MKADILYNYATPPFSDREDLDKIKKNRISQPIIEIGIVGTLLKAKGIESSILAFSDAINLIPNIRLCIYGSGPEKKYFEKICSKYLPANTYKFFGHVTNKQTIFKNMSVLLHSSYTEGTSRAVLEALSAHVVVLHRAIKGSEELIIPGHNGYLFKDKKTISQDIYRSIELSRNIQRSNRDIEYLLPVNFTKLKFNEKIAELINSI